MSYVSGIIHSLILARATREYPLFICLESEGVHLQKLETQSDQIKRAQTDAPNNSTTGQNLPPSIEECEVGGRFISTEGKNITLRAGVAIDKVNVYANNLYFDQPDGSADEPGIRLSQAADHTDVDLGRNTSSYTPIGAPPTKTSIFQVTNFILTTFALNRTMPNLWKPSLCPKSFLYQ